MFEEFGAHQAKDVTGQLLPQAVFQVFFPRWGTGNDQYVYGGETNIREMKVFGTFQATPWEEAAALNMKGHPFKGGELWEATTGNLQPGFYHYRFIVFFGNGEKRITGDPCTKYSVEGVYEVCGFVIDDPNTYSQPNLIPLGNRLPTRELNIYECHIGDFASQISAGDTPVDAIIAKLDQGYFTNLGINAIEFMPWTGWLGKGFSWGYDSYLFFSVEERYVGNINNPTVKIDKLVELINKCHTNNIHVIMDCVLNHTYADSRGKGFPYYSLYQKPDDCPFLGSYMGGGFFMDFDYNNECTQLFIFDVCKYWIKDFGIDGIRFDYTKGYYDPVSKNCGITRLVSDLRQYLDYNRQINFSMIIEHIDSYYAIDACNKIKADACWYEPFYWISRNALYDLRRKAVPIESNIMRLLNSGSYFDSGQADKPEKIPITYIETHDHAQVASNAEGQAKWYRTQPWVIALYTTTGATMIHNGQEFGDDYWLPEHDGEGGQRRVVPRPVRWNGKANTSEGNKTLALYKKLIGIRKNHTSLCSINFEPGSWDEQQNSPVNGYGVDLSKGIVIYRRWGKNNAGKDENFIVVINFTESDQWVDIPFPYDGNWIDLLTNFSISVTGNRVFNFRVPDNWGYIFLQV